MAQNFLAADRKPPFLLPPDVREWLPENHLAWFVIDAVGVMDTAAFYAAYRADGHGRAAYEPSMMLALLLYSWSRGVRSSRAIERACVEDVACRVIAAHQQPDHATIARFVERHEQALGDVFGEVLRLCADAGLATVGVIAIDGTKVAANASRDRTMSYEHLARTIVKEAIATDAAETAQHGERRGDELPEIVATSQGREGRLRAARQRLDQQRAERGEPIPRSRSDRLLEAKRRLEEEHQVQLEANSAYQDYRRDGRMKNGRRLGAHSPPKPYVPPETPAGKVNPTDLDSTLVHGMRGWLQGYNAQAVCNERHLIVAAEVMTASPDFGHLGPMLTGPPRAQRRRRHARARRRRRRRRLLAPRAVNEITGDGIPVLIPPDSSRRRNKPKRPGWNGGAYDFMRSVLSTDRGAALYKQRAQLIEPIFGDTKHNRGFTRFARRGRSAARTEWRLMATTHNLLKLHQHFTAEENSSSAAAAHGAAPTPNAASPAPLRDSLRRLQQRAGWRRRSHVPRGSSGWASAQRRRDWSVRSDTGARLRASGRCERLGAPRRGDEAMASAQRATPSLQDFLDAFNAHDVDAVMSFFADDCVFDMPRGPAPGGRRLTGKPQVRAGIQSRFDGIPDVQYGDDRHWTCGDRGVSEWTIRGTQATGERIEVRGCDLFEFADGKISRKDSFWKIID